MPMQSQAQRKYLHVKHPDVAARFEKETPKGKALPARKGKKRRPKDEDMKKAMLKRGRKKTKQ